MTPFDSRNDSLKRVLMSGGNCLSGSGPIAWSSLTLALRRDGIYDELCDASLGGALQLEPVLKALGFSA